MDKGEHASMNWKIFNDAFESEIEAQEFMIDEAEWLAVIKALKVAQETMENTLYVQKTQGLT